jgi:hypothetical protein
VAILGLIVATVKKLDQSAITRDILS